MEVLEAGRGRVSQKLTSPKMEFIYQFHIADS